MNADVSRSKTPWHLVPGTTDCYVRYDRVTGTRELRVLAVGEEPPGPARGEEDWTWGEGGREEGAE